MDCGNQVDNALGRDRIIDGWRGCSVLTVILCHTVTERYESSFDPDDRLYILCTGLGSLGVQFFFVISGYLITTLLLRERTNTGQISLIAFYLRRGFRILPAAMLMIGCTLVAASLGYIAVAPRGFTFAATFTCNATTQCGWFLGHLWSLAVEEQFYLVWPCLIVLMGSRTVPMLAASCTIVFLILSQLRVFDVGRIDNGISFACIGFGCWYAASVTVRTVIARLASPLLIVVALLLLVLRPVTPLLFHGSQRLESLLVPALICFVIFACSNYRERIESFAAVRLLARVGLTSYGLYLWQQLFLAAPEKYLRLSTLSTSWAFVPLALLSYLLLERPLIRYGGRLSKELIARGERPRPAVGASTSPVLTDP